MSEESFDIDGLISKVNANRANDIKAVKDEGSFDKVCVVCGKHFNTNYPQKRACGPACAREKIRRDARGHYLEKKGRFAQVEDGKLVYPETSHLSELDKKCVICGRPKAKRKNAVTCGNPSCRRERHRRNMKAMMAKKRGKEVVEPKGIEALLLKHKAISTEIAQLEKERSKTVKEIESHLHAVGIKGGLI